MVRIISLSFILSHLSILPLSAQRMDNIPVHSKYIQAVDEYRPAPGQFVNDLPEYEAGDTEADMIPVIEKRHCLSLLICFSCC